MKEMRGWQVAGLVTVTTAIIISCSESSGPRYQPRTQPSYDLGSAPQQLTLKDVLPGTPVSQTSGVRDHLLQLLGDIRTAFLQTDALFHYDVYSGSHGTDFDVRPDVTSTPMLDDNAIQVAVRVERHDGQEDLNLYLAPAGSRKFRKFTFQPFVDLYGYFLYSNDAMAIFEANEKDRRQLVKLSLRPTDRGLNLWLYGIREGEALEAPTKPSDALPPLDLGPATKPLSLVVRQEIFVIPLTNGQGTAPAPTGAPGVRPMRAPLRRQDIPPRHSVSPTVETSSPVEAGSQDEN